MEKKSYSFLVLLSATLACESVSQRDLVHVKVSTKQTAELHVWKGGGEEERRNKDAHFSAILVAGVIVTLSEKIVLCWWLFKLLLVHSLFLFFK